MKIRNNILLTQAVACALFFSSFNTLFGKRNRHRQHYTTSYYRKGTGPNTQPHKTSTFQHYSSVNGKSERVNMSYTSSITLSNDNGVKEHLKSQLDLKSMNDQKEILIESLQGKNDFPAHLKIDSNSEDITLTYVMISIKGPSITLTFAIGEEGPAYKLEYDVNEHSFDRALKKIQTIDRNDHVASFKEKTKNMPTYDSQSMEDFQKNIQSQMDNMGERMNRMMEKINKLFKNNLSF